MVENSTDEFYVKLEPQEDIEEKKHGQKRPRAQISLNQSDVDNTVSFHQVPTETHLHTNTKSRKITKFSFEQVKTDLTIRGSVNKSKRQEFITDILRKKLLKKSHLVNFAMTHLNNANDIDHKSLGAIKLEKWDPDDEKFPESSIQYFFIHRLMNSDYYDIPILILSEQALLIQQKKQKKQEIAKKVAIKRREEKKAKDALDKKNGGTKLNQVDVLDANIIDSYTSFTQRKMKLTDLFSSSMPTTLVYGPISMSLKYQSLESDDMDEIKIFKKDFFGLYVTESKSFSIWPSTSIPNLEMDEDVISRMHLKKTESGKLLWVAIPRIHSGSNFKHLQIIYDSAPDPYPRCSQ